MKKNPDPYGGGTIIPTGMPAIELFTAKYTKLRKGTPKTGKPPWLNIHSITAMLYILSLLCVTLRPLR